MVPVSYVHCMCLRKNAAFRLPASRNEVSTLQHIVRGCVQVLQRVLLTLQRRAPSQLLAHELWVCARDAEAWWAMRQSYTASLALSSIAAYLLGIGDRHLNNILVVQNSGQVP